MQKSKVTSSYISNLSAIERADALAKFIDVKPPRRVEPMHKNTQVLEYFVIMLIKKNAKFLNQQYHD